MPHQVLVCHGPPMRPSSQTLHAAQTLSLVGTTGQPFDRHKAFSQCGAYAGHLAGASFAVALIATTADSFDLGQAAAYLQLAAWELGIGSCIASMWEPEKAKAILDVPHDQHFDVAISFGYPLTSPEQSHTPKPNGRKPFDEVVFWERWSG